MVSKLDLQTAFKNEFLKLSFEKLVCKTEFVKMSFENCFPN